MYFYIVESNPNPDWVSKSVAGTEIEGRVVAAMGKTNLETISGMVDIDVELPVDLQDVVKKNRLVVTASFESDYPILVYRVKLSKFGATIRAYAPLSAVTPKSVKMSVLVPAILRSNPMETAVLVPTKTITEEPKPKKRGRKKKQK